MYPSGLHFQKSSSSSSFDMSVYKTVSVSPAAEMPSSQLCFVYLSNYPSLIPLKDWLAGICLVFFPQSLWSCAHKYLLTARQKRWSPDPKPEGPESNEWRLQFICISNWQAYFQISCMSLQAESKSRRQPSFSQASVPRAPVFLWGRSLPWFHQAWKKMPSGPSFVP